MKEVIIPSITSFNVTLHSGILHLSFISDFPSQSKPPLEASSFFLLVFVMNTECPHVAGHEGWSHADHSQLTEKDHEVIYNFGQHSKRISIYNK